MTPQTFIETVWDFYHENGRHDLPWRLQEADGSFDPYKIMVSEIMLQQTQVARVISKYTDFLMRFPTLESLATAPQSDVLRAWSGLGYNRRAKFLHQAANQIHHASMGFPETLEDLVALPGIGINTAGAIMAYAFNKPAIFIETNIRTVFIYHFLKDAEKVSDHAIRDLLEATLDRENPREWYWALMDYGSYLKQRVGNVSRQSKSYAKQSTFQGSKRQIRGQILQALREKPLSLNKLSDLIADERLVEVVNELVAEGLIHQQKSHFSL